MSAPHARESVQDQLERITSSKTFGSVPRSVKMLQFVVNETLTGNADHLKEYTIGAKALDRGDRFDPRTDPIVRAEASRLRTRLALYYGTEGKGDTLVISLPKGSYVPLFEPRAQEAASIPSRDARWKLATLFLAMAALGAASWAWRAGRATPLPLTRLEIELRSGGSLGATVGADVAISPDGSRLAFIAQDANGVARLYTRRLDEEKTVEIQGTEGARGHFFSPDGQWIAFDSQSKLKKAPAAGGPSIVLCDAPNLLGASWGDDGNIYAVLDGTGQLSRIPSAGGQPVAVPGSAPTLDFWPQVLPGSSAALVTSVRGGLEAVSIEVLSLKDGTRKTVARGGTYARYLPNGYLVYLSAGTLLAQAFDPVRQEARGAPVAILNDVAYSPTFGYGHVAFSNNGTLVYRRASNLMDIQWLDSSGQTEPLLAKPARYVRPRLSPDGRRLAYSTADVSVGVDSWIFDIREGKTTRLGSTGVAYGQPLWTPGGEFLLLAGRQGAAWLRANGTDHPKPLLSSQTAQVPLSFPSSGKRLSYLEFSPVTGLDLWTVPVEIEGGEVHAGKPEPFLVTPAQESQAMFSADGRWLAYCSTESGSWEVYVQPFPPDGTRVQVSRDGGRIPFWSSNGRELFYATERQRVMKVQYEVRGRAFVPASPVVWTERRFADTGVSSALDLHPDGKRFAALMPAEPPGQQQSPNHVTMLLNFFGEVERKVAAQK